MAHAIRPRDWAQDLPRKVRALGMRIALSSKLQMGLLRVVADLNEGKWTKTGQANRALSDGWVQRGVAKEGRSSAEMTPDVAEESVADDETVLEDEPVLENQPLLEDQLEPSHRLETTEEPSMPPAKDKTYEHVTRFGPNKELSILFVHPPEKTAESIWPFARVIRNIPGVEIMSTDQVEVYYILKFKWLIMEGGAVDAIIRQKGQAPVAEVDLGLAESDTSESTLAGGERDEGKTARMPKTWRLRTWRHDTGAKSLRKVFGMNNATRMEKEWKKAAKTLKQVKLA